MKKLLLLLVIFTATANAQIVNIPDAQFKANLLSASPTVQVAQDFSDQWIKIDANNDGEIQVSEAQAVKSLVIGQILVMNTTGLESFSNLESLRFNSSLVTTLNVTALTNLKALTCTNMQILSSINLSASTNLESLTCVGLPMLSTLNLSGLANLSKLFVFSTNVANLNVSGLTGLTEIMYSANQNATSFTVSSLPNLTKLNCSYNALNTLTLSGLNNLTELDCSANVLTNLNGLPAGLTKLNCENNKFTALSLNGLTSLSELSCGGNELTSLDVNGLTNLTKLACSHNKLATLSISNLPNLVTLNCGNNNELTSVTLANLTSLQELSVIGNVNSSADTLSNLSSLNLSGLPNLQKIICYYGKLTSLNLSGLPSLKEVNCSSNLLTSLTLTNLPNLEKLDCSRNYITSLDASSLANLKELITGNAYIVGGQLIGQLTSLNVAGLSNLKKLNCATNLLTSLDLTGLTSLEELYCDGAANNLGQITSLNVNGLSNLRILSCTNQQLTSLNVSNLINLTHLYCAYNHITSLDLTGLINLRILDYNYNQLANLNLVDLPSLTNLNCAHNYLETLNVLNLTSLTDLNCAYNQLTTLNLSGLTSLVSLDMSYNELTLADIGGLSTNLKTLVCIANNLTSLDVSGLPNLETLNCNSNNLPSLDVSSLTGLKFLDFSRNNISNIDVAPLYQLELLNAAQNQLTNLNINGLNNLITVYCGDNFLTSLDVTNHQQNLKGLDYSNNVIPNLDVNFLTNLTYLGCATTQSTTLDVSNLVNLQTLYCHNNQLTTLNVNNSPALNTLRCNDNQLTTLFLKNGRAEQDILFSNNPTLEYICADESQLESIQTTLNGLGMNATVCNSYCTFSPGGNRNTITGITIFDEDNNGCDVTDVVNPFIRLNVTNNADSTEGATVTNINGTYNFYTGAGDYTIAPNTENPTWFTFSPASANFSFLNDNNNISTQNFCINAVGVHKDVEVVFVQTEPARPGFDAKYKLVYKNKGNQMISGTVDLQFDDNRTDFVAATPATDATGANSLSWNFTNLMPFENRSIEIILNINSPMETPAVNNGDILNFIASIPVTGDELPSDNQFNYNQTVVGSFDPNDITCLEGESLTPAEIGNYLHYIVNFENTGTFYAENVVVRLEVDSSKYDMNSLQLLNSSNPSSTRISGNIVEFVMEDINLAAAAGNPPVGGHGDVLFKIRTKDNLVTNDTVLQRAGIYFDYNFPVITNDAETTFEELSNPIFEHDNSVRIYPNPTKSVINISCNTAIQSIELYDIQGRLLETRLENSSNVTVDISSKQNGVYFLKITSENGSKVEKVVKE